MLALASTGTLLEDEPYADWAAAPREHLDWLRQEARLALARDRASGKGTSHEGAVIAAWEDCLGGGGGKRGGRGAKGEGGGGDWRRKKGGGRGGGGGGGRGGGGGGGRGEEGGEGGGGEGGGGGGTEGAERKGRKGRGEEGSHDLTCEEAALAVMQAYAAQNRQALVESTYSRCRTALEHLGLRISPALEQFHEAVRSPLLGPRRVRGRSRRLYRSAG